MLLRPPANWSITIPRGTPHTCANDALPSKTPVISLVDDYIKERFDEANDLEEHNTIRFLTSIIRKRASSSYHTEKYP
ncbi:MAG: hypothetical protein WA667_25085 [Candidatus Nitrosopolaris sp.]